MKLQNLLNFQSDHSVKHHFLQIWANILKYGLANTTQTTLKWNGFDHTKKLVKATGFWICRYPWHLGCERKKIICRNTILKNLEENRNWYVPREAKARKIAGAMKETSLKTIEMGSVSVSEKECVQLNLPKKALSSKHSVTNAKN